MVTRDGQGVLRREVQAGRRHPVELQAFFQIVAEGDVFDAQVRAIFQKTGGNAPVAVAVIYTHFGDIGIGVGGCPAVQDVAVGIETTRLGFVSKIAVEKINVVPLHALNQKGEVKIFVLGINIEAVDELREGATQMGAVFVVDKAILVQICKFDVTRAGIHRLKRALGNFFLRLENTLHLVQEKRTNRIPWFRFGDGPIRKAKTTQNGFGIRNGKHLIAHQRKIGRDAVTALIGAALLNAPAVVEVQVQPFVFYLACVDVRRIGAPTGLWHGYAYNDVASGFLVNVGS